MKNGRTGYDNLGAGGDHLRKVLSDDPTVNLDPNIQSSFINLSPQAPYLV
jgi:hypothetical protein